MSDANMKKTDELLARHGWSLDCWSPLEISHEESNSTATNWAAKSVIADLEKEESDANE